MNYYRLQSTYFLIFIAFTAMIFAAFPMVRQSFADTSDVYVKSQMNRIQGEMFFMDQKRSSFSRACYSGTISLIIQDLIQEYGRSVACYTDKPIYSELMVCAQLRSGSHYCVDKSGITCEISKITHPDYSCKKLSRAY